MSGTLLRLFNKGTCQSQSDGELLSAFIDSEDALAFEGLVSRHGPLVLAVCRRWLTKTEDVEDAFQSVFLVLIRKSPRLSQRENLGPWLRSVADKTARRAWSKVKKRERLEVQLAAVTAEFEAPATRGDREVLDRVWLEVSRLPDRYRLPVELCYREGKSGDEAARMLGCPTGTLKGRLSRARKLLMKRLGGIGLAPAAAIEALAKPEPTSAALLRKLSLSTLQKAGGSVFGAHKPVRLLAQAITLSQLTREIMIMSNFIKYGLALCIVVGVVAATGSMMVAARTQRQLALAQEREREARQALALQQDAVQKTNADQQTNNNPDANLASIYISDVDRLQPATNAQDIEKLKKLRLQSAKVRLDISNAQYEVGKVSIDRLISAAESYLEAELAIEDDDAERLKSFAACRDRMQALMKRELQEYNVGRGTIADLAEVQEAFYKAEIRLGEAKVNQNAR